MTEAYHGLHRSDRSRVIAGVCGGLAESWQVDPTLIRLGWALLTLSAFFLGAGLYLAAWFILPVRHESGVDMPEAAAERRGVDHALQGRRLGLVVGWLLIAAGVFYLADHLTGGLILEFWRQIKPFVWPILLIAAGGALLLYRGEGRQDRA